MKTGKKIMVSAYACEPFKGSEPGVGWNWVLQMSKYFDLWVLTRESNRENIENYFKDNNIESDIHFLYFDLPKWARFWKKGMRGVRTYYTLWTIATNSVIKRVMKREGIDIYHHLTYGNSLWTVSSYGKKQTFIWGPTGGVDTIPAEFSKHYTVQKRLLEWIRRCVVAALPLNLGFRSRCRHADIILCKTNHMRDAICEKYRDKGVIFTDVAPENKEKTAAIEKTENRSKTEFIIVGKMDAWRGFDLSIYAIKKLSERFENVHLTILGDGKDKARLKEIAERINAEELVEFKGFVGYDEYHSIMKSCDVVLNPALKEGAVTVSFDALYYGKPIICVDTGGYTRYFKSGNAIVIEKSSFEETIEGLSEAMEKVMDKGVREELSERALKTSDAYNWDTKGIEIRDMILKVADGR